MQVGWFPIECVSRVGGVTCVPLFSWMYAMPYKDKDKQREYQRKWMKSRRRAFFDGKSCLICGSFDELELHHRDPSQKIHHAIWSWSQTRRDVELAKCDVLCRTCHDTTTAAHLIETRTHCPQGHPYSGDNLRVREKPDGWNRECRECDKLAHRLRREKVLR